MTAEVVVTKSVLGATAEVTEKAESLLKKTKQKSQQPQTKAPLPKPARNRAHTTTAAENLATIIRVILTATTIAHLKPTKTAILIPIYIKEPSYNKKHRIYIWQRQTTRK